MDNRLVHLDLKGAPPKLEYLLQVLPLFKRLGATGLLLEYEDTFPYVGELECLTTICSYSRSDIDDLLATCSQLNLTVIPLVQTYGHLEYVLKHDSFRHFREMPLYPNSICPCNEAAFAVLCNMLDQLLAAHPSVEYIHIGCDEVGHIGACDLCRQKLEDMQWSTGHLYLYHVTRVANHIGKIRPSVRPIIWDDILRHVEPSVMQAFALGDAVDIMVWYYGADGFPAVLQIHSVDIVPALPYPRKQERYQLIVVGDQLSRGHCRAVDCRVTKQCINRKVNMVLCVLNVALHVQNQKLWLAVLEDQRMRVTQFCGIALTGWQRYDHYASLCELLPTGLPSLALCLRILVEGSFSEQCHIEASLNLGLDKPMTLIEYPRPQPVELNWTFPGKEVCIGSHWQANLLAQVNAFFDSESMKCWFNSYNVRRNFTNPAHVERFYAEAMKMRKDLASVESHMRYHMSQIYMEPVVNEWLGEHIHVLHHRLDVAIEQMKCQLEIKFLANTT